MLNSMQSPFHNVISALGQYSDTPLDDRLELVHAPEDQRFWLQDGRSLGNLHDLRAVLEDMSQETFETYVNKEKNDFANWVEFVLHDAECAKSLRRCSKPLSAKRVVIKFLKNYR